MNPLTGRVTSGTIGELLVQLRLLQFEVQAAPPLRDSGDDLIAIRGRVVKSIQVRSAWGRRPAPPTYRTVCEYDGVAFVRLAGEPTLFRLDESSVYLVPKGRIGELQGRGRIEQCRLNAQTVDALFADSQR
jgi:hypothetical protein